MKKSKMLVLMLAFVLAATLFAVACGSIKVTGVSLNKTELSLIMGRTEMLTATVAPSDAPNKSVTWASSNSAIASVDTNGRVTAVSLGTATITVTTEEGGHTATCAVTVTPVAVADVTLNKNILGMQVQNTETLIASVSPTSANNKAVTWGSSKESVATVNANGEVKAVAIGTAVITVTTVDGNKTDQCTVEVLSKEISSAADFAKMNLKLDGDFYLTKDIDFNRASVTPIGTWKTTTNEKFTGTFDGKGFALSNLVMSGSLGNALFCQIGEGGTVKNLNIIDIKAYGSSSCAGIAGSNAGTVENCYVQGDLYSDMGSASNIQAYGGTLVGTNEATGVVRSSVSYCTTNRTYTFAGNNHGRIENSYVVYEDIANIDSPNTQFASVMKDTDAGYTEGYVIGTFTDCRTLTLDDLSTTPKFSFDKLNAGSWVIPAETKVGPYLKTAAGTVRSWFVFPDPLVGVQEISTVDDLINIRANRATRSADYVLMNDIDIGSVEWSSLGEFKGTFNGKGHTIYNMKNTDANGSGNLGFFKFVMQGAVVENLTLEGMRDGSFTQFQNWAGGLCQNNYGTIRNCIINIKMIASDTKQGIISGIACNNYGGGLIQNCVVLSQIKGLGTEPQASWGAANAWNGGILNGTDAQSTILYTFFDKDVANSGETDAVKGKDLVSYGIGQKSEETGMEKTTAEMKTAATYADFDTAIWNIVNGQYPSLKVQS